MSTPIWAERARARMRELGLRQIDLLEPLGVTSRGAVGNYLSGRRNPSIKQGRALAKALNMSFDELFAESDLTAARDGERIDIEAQGRPARASTPPITESLGTDLDDHEMDLAIDAIRLVGEVYKELKAPVDAERFTAHVLAVYRAMHEGQHVTHRKVVRLVSSR